MTKSAVAFSKTPKAPMAQEKKDAIFFWSVSILLALAFAAGWSYIEFGHFWGMLGLIPIGMGAPAIYDFMR